MTAEQTITINGENWGTARLKQKFSGKPLPEWESKIYRFILNWFDNSGYILQKTSGSTGEPKEIKLKKSAMTRSAKATLGFFHLQPGNTAWLCLPVDYIAGKMMVVRAIEGKLNLIITEPEGTPIIPVQPIDFTAMVPLQLKKLIREKADFFNIRKLIVGGAPVDFLSQKALQTIPSEVFATYGMTETCSHIALQRLNGTNPDWHFHLLEGITVSTNAENCLVINAPGITDQTLETTDIAEIISPTEFRILGRTDNVINSGGIKISPENLEKKITQLIDCDCIVTFKTDSLLGQKLVLVIEKVSTKCTEQQILDQLKPALPKYEIPKEVIFIDQFPRNQSLKIDRKKINDQIGND